MKLARKIIGVQQPPDEQAGRADVTTKFHNITSRAALQYCFQLAQQSAKFFGINLVGDDGIFGEEVVGDHY